MGEVPCELGERGRDPRIWLPAVPTLAIYLRQRWTWSADRVLGEGGLQVVEVSRARLLLLFLILTIQQRRHIQATLEIQQSHAFAWG